MYIAIDINLTDFNHTVIFFTVCLGAFGDMAKCLELAEETPKLSRRSGHQLERQRYK